MSIDDRVARLVARRVPFGEIAVGFAYVVHARNGGIGVATRDGSKLSYLLRREKFGRLFLFAEIDWDHGPPFGTAIPLRMLKDEPPMAEVPLLEWLAERELENRSEIDEAWRKVLGG